MTTSKQDTPDAWRQSWYNWVRMAEKTLVGAARMAWHSEDERTLDISLFGKVTGLPPMTVATWRDSVTWTETVLLGLSIEQCLKGLIIRASPDGKYPRHHNLLRLWDALGDCDRQGIADEIVALARRTAGTRFDAFPTPATLTTDAAQDYCYATDLVDGKIAALGHLLLRHLHLTSTADPHRGELKGRGLLLTENDR